MSLYAFPRNCHTVTSTVLLNIAEMGKLHTEVGKFLPGAKCSSRVPFVKSRVSVTKNQQNKSDCNINLLQSNNKIDRTVEQQHDINSTLETMDNDTMDLLCVTSLKKMYPKYSFLTIG